jgi:hypothetical protein
MAESRERFMAPKMDQIYEDRGEDFDATYKVKSYNPQNSSDMRRFDSMPDTTNLALP